MKLNREQCKELIETYCIDVPPETGFERLLSTDFQPVRKTNQTVEIAPNVHVLQTTLDRVLYGPTVD